MQEEFRCENCGEPLTPQEKEESDLCFDCKKLKETSGICALCIVGAAILIAGAILWQGAIWLKDAIGL